MNLARAARAVAASLAVVELLLLAFSVRADGLTIGIRYQAPPGCPTEPEFLSDVRQRNTRVAAASPVESAQLLVTIAESTGPRFYGRLERATSNGIAGVRDIGGDSCREVASALALITALTADLSPTSPRPASPEAPAVVDVATERAPDREAPERSAPPDVRGVSQGRWQVGMEGFVASGITPNALAGAAAFVQVGARSSAFWSPSLRLSASFALSSWSSSVASSSAQASFQWGVASLDGCPVQFGDPLDVSIAPCARITVGLLRASGSGRNSSSAESVVWSDAGALLRAHWLVRRTLFFDAEAEAFVPRVRYVFDFTYPTDTADVAGNVGFRFGAGMGILFR